MSEEQEIPEKIAARTEAIPMIVSMLKQWKAGKQPSRTIWTYWSNVKIKMGKEATAKLEANPDDVEMQQELNDFMKEQMKGARGFMSVIQMVETFKAKG
jgi:hypothetical protein